MTGVGTLIGVGLGPGDPELMTLKADRLIRGATVIAYPAPAGGASFARRIASQSIPAGITEIPIEIPMDARRFPAQAVYDTVASVIAGHLDQGQDVVTLCEGDPFFYGSFMYLFSRLAVDYPTEVVPGVTSVTACAAALKRPLSARNETLSVIPGTLTAPELRERLEQAQAAAIIKIGRHLPKIRSVIEELGLTSKAGFVARATLEDEVVTPLADAPEAAPYFSMILMIRGDDPWLN